MPLILSGTFLLVLGLIEFDLPNMLPFCDPWSFCHLAHPCLGPQLVTFWFLILFLAVVVIGFFGKESNLRYINLK